MHGLGIVKKSDAKQTARSLSPIILVARILDFSAGRMTQKIWACQKYGEASGTDKNKGDVIRDRSRLALILATIRLNHLLCFLFRKAHSRQFQLGRQIISIHRYIISSISFSLLFANVRYSMLLFPFFMLQGRHNI